MRRSDYRRRDGMHAADHLGSKIDERKNAPRRAFAAGKRVGKSF